MLVYVCVCVRVSVSVCLRANLKCFEFVRFKTHIGSFYDLLVDNDTCLKVKLRKVLLYILAPLSFHMEPFCCIVCVSKRFNIAPGISNE